MAIRVVFAEDSYIIREGLEQVLATADGVEIVASCEDMDGVLAAVSEQPRPRERDHQGRGRRAP